MPNTRSGKSEYRLIYWGGIPGRGEFVRLCFEFKKHPYDNVSDARVVSGTMRNASKTGHPPAFAPPMLQVQVEGKTYTIAQTGSILVSGISGTEMPDLLTDRNRTTLLPGSDWMERRGCKAKKQKSAAHRSTNSSSPSSISMMKGTISIIPWLLISTTRTRKPRPNGVLMQPATNVGASDIFKRASLTTDYGMSIYHRNSPVPRVLRFCAGEQHGRRQCGLSFRQ